MHDVELIITDLDNTLYDWVSFFVPAFEAMIDKAVEMTRIERDTLLDEMRIIHQRYGNSEEPFALLEAPSLIRALGISDRRKLAEVLDPAFYAFNKVRAQSLKLYDGVSDTLAAMRASGMVVVGHTEARVGSAIFRVSKLGLGTHLSRIYAAPEMGLGHPGDPPPHLLELERRLVVYLPTDHHKPNPATLLDICDEHRVRPEMALYVGDSLTRDIYMANRAGVHSALAAYGASYDRSLWTKLVRVTHWTEAAVRRAQALNEEASDARPDVVLHRFDELLAYLHIAPVQRHPA